MKIITLTLILIIQLMFADLAFSQQDSILDQSIWRNFIVHLPNNYNSSNQYPLVINLHGLNSNAAQQQSYSQFDVIADMNNFIVVYPNANAGSWVINGNSDVDFISHLIDTISNRYSCNSCLFITGMSQGGFLTYKLACSLPQSIKAIAVVSGNISQNLKNTCSISNGLPLLHFHGTADSLVKYNGTLGIPPVPSNIDWLVTQNNCNATPVFSSLPDTNLSDSSNVEKYYYGSGTNSSEVTFYKIINGGHTWPGASPVPPFGFTNLDINASQIIGNFFSQHCSFTTNLSEPESQNISIYPNPFTSNIKHRGTTGTATYTMTNSFGQMVWSGNEIEQQDFSKLSSGIYFLTIVKYNDRQIVKLLKE